MEPKIYKRPGIYKSSVYKSPGIYNGSGVYNDGAEEFVEIGGKKYPVVTIGSQKWIAENLDLTFDSLIIGQSDVSDTQPKANYYNNDEQTNGYDGKKYNLLYNWIAVNYINTNKLSLCNGYRVPTILDYEILANYCGGKILASKKLKSKTDWLNTPGIDEYKFNALPAGHYDGTFNELGESCNFWTIDQQSITHGRNVYMTGNSDELYIFGTPHKRHEMSLRLIKE